jgi:hypothetical protein
LAEGDQSLDVDTLADDEVDDRFGCDCASATGTWFERDRGV